MSKSLLWTTAVFIVFAFATLIVFFWIRDGSLEQAWRRLIGACGRVCTRGGDPLLTSPF